MVDKKTVMKVAALARLHVSEEMATVYENQFRKILEYFDKLQTVSTEGIDPMLSPMEQARNYREDIVQKELSVEDILQNAPDSKGHLFKVPPVV